MNKSENAHKQSAQKPSDKNQNPERKPRSGFFSKKRGRMDIAIQVTAAIAALLVLVTTVVGTSSLNNKFTVTLWLGYATAVIVLLGGCLYWQKQHWASAVVETSIRGLLSPAVIDTSQKPTDNDIVIRFGSSLAFFSEPTATLFRCGDEDILSFERVKDGVYVNAVVYSETGEEVARITKNIFRAKNDNRYLVVNPNPHTLAIIGPDDKRIFSIEYLNQRVIKILGIFRCKSPSVPWIIEEGRTLGGGGITMSNSQIVLDKGTALDILHWPAQEQSK